MRTTLLLAPLCLLGCNPEVEPSSLRVTGDGPGFAMNLSAPVIRQALQLSVTPAYEGEELELALEWSSNSTFTPVRGTSTIRGFVERLSEGELAPEDTVARSPLEVVVEGDRADLELGPFEPVICRWEGGGTSPCVVDYRLYLVMQAPDAVMAVQANSAAELVVTGASEGWDMDGTSLSLTLVAE